MASITTTSIVFTDLVGSTALSSSLRAAEADDVRRTHFSLLRAAVLANKGREVKNLGDGLMAVFPSLSAALAGATNIQQRVELHNRSAAHRLEIRIGLSTGDVTEEDGDYFGTPVIEAARLCAAAAGGQILTTELVRALSSQRGFTLLPIGELTLKGLPQPTAAVSVSWDPLPAETAANEAGKAGNTDQPTRARTIPIPTRVAAAATTTFVGRETERSVLAAALSDVSAGKGPRVVLLAGEPGLGKTSLAARFAIDTHTTDPNTNVLYGRCEEELAVPYLPFVEAIEHVVTDAPDDVISAYITGHAAELGHLVPALALRVAVEPSSTTADPDTARYVLFAAVAGLLKAVSAPAPLILILDDLHWADKATLLLLRHLITTVELPGVLVIGTYRDSELHASQPLADTLAALRRERGVERIALPGLGDRDLAALLGITSGDDIDTDRADLARALHAETDGNPFFVGEILRHLVETGGLHRGGTPDQTASILPESVREVVGRRVARLGDATYRALSAAAVIGRDFDLDLLAAVTTTDHDTLLDQLEDARAASLVDEIEGADGHFTFAHALIQHTLYEDLGAARRARTHARVAQAIEDQTGPIAGERVGEIARHWLAAVRPADTTKARLYAGLAGDRALQGRAPDEAVRWYQAALGLVGDEPPDLKQRNELLIGLGQAQLQTGAQAYRQTLLEAARLAQANGDNDALVRAALANSRGFVSIVGQVDEDRVAVLEGALEAAGPADSPARARLLATLAAELTYAGDADARIALARDAEAVARRVADPRLILDTLNLASLATQIPPLLPDRIALSAEAVELAARIDDPSAKFWAASFRATVTAEAGDGTGLREAIDAMEDIADALGQPVCRWRTMVWQSMLTCLSGKTEEAERLATEALQIGSDAGEPDALAFFGATLATIRTTQGRLAEIVTLLGDAADANPGLPAYRGVHASALLDAGDTEAAAASLARAASARFTDIPMDPLWTIALGCWADVAARLGDRDAAAALTELLEPWHGHVPIPTCAAHFSIAHWLGVLATACANYDPAERYLLEALEIHERLDAPCLVAGTELALAETLTLRGHPADQDRVDTLLASSLDLATRHNLGAIEWRARSAKSW